MPFSTELGPPLSIAVIGAGITGLSAAWLLSRSHHHVTLYEKNDRLGGHANTVSVDVDGERVDVDTGFIVYNEANYPNFVALLQSLNVATNPSDMSFAVSLGARGCEYSSNDVSAFLGGGRNLLSPRFVQMVLDLLRFYKTVETRTTGSLSLGEFLQRERYSDAFQRDHILPMAAAIWSSSIEDMRDYPLDAFVRFYVNHGLLNLARRPAWRTVSGGSRSYVSAIQTAIEGKVARAHGVRSVTPSATGVSMCDETGETRIFDRVLIATHADQALNILEAGDSRVRAHLAAIPYRPNRAVLHTDTRFMPKRRRTWSSWNYVGENASAGCAVTYWMNRLQQLPTAQPLFVTLNPSHEPAPGSILWEGSYDHPCFSHAAMRAQREIWPLQGRDGIWFAGAWAGAGFHEDGLQAGLAAAEVIGGVRRPWSVENESGRLALSAVAIQSAPTLSEAA